MKSRMLLLLLLLLLLLASLPSRGWAQTYPNCNQVPNLACANAADTITGVWTLVGAGPLILDGATAGTNATTVSVADPTGARTLYIPDANSATGKAQDCASGNHLDSFDPTTGNFACTADSGGGGDVLAAGPGCLAGNCLTDGVVTEAGVDTLAVWEGATDNTSEYYIKMPAADPAGDLTWTFPTTTGNLVGTGDTGTVTSTMIATDTIVAGDIATGAVATTEILDDTITVSDVNQTYTLAGNPAMAASEVWFATTGLIFEGLTANTFEGLLAVADVTADHTWTLPDVDGNVVTTGDSGSVTGGMIADTFHIWNETRTGTGSLAGTPRTPDTLLAFSNGLTMKRVGACGGVGEYTLAGATFTFCDATNNSPALVTYEQ